MTEQPTKENPNVSYEKTDSGKVKRVTVKLDFDFEAEGKHYKELTFRRMKTKDTYSGEDEPDETRAGLILYARLASVPMAVIDELDFEDLETITEAIIPLMGKSAGQIVRTEMDKIKANQDDE